MSKPSFIPQDVWDKALEASNAEQSYIVMSIATAIMQDRGNRVSQGLDVVVPPPYFPPSSPMTNGGGTIEAPIDVPSDIWSAVSAKLWYGMEFRAAVWEACNLVMAERARTRELLSDPVAVKLNYMRGDIDCSIIMGESNKRQIERCAQELETRSSNARTAERKSAYKSAAVIIGAMEPLWSK